MKPHLIQILDIPSGIPSRFLDGGKLYLDLPSPFSFRLNKSRSELSDVNEIKDESAFTVALPRTPKNDFIFSSFILPNTEGEKVKRYSVFAIFGAMPLKQNIGIPIKLNDSDNPPTLDFQLIKDDDFWLKGAKDFTIDELDFGSFTYTKANIKSTWDNGAYTSGDQGVVYSNIDFGWNPVDEDDEKKVWEWQISHFRPLISIPALLQKGFCAIGWRLDFPLLQTDWGSRLWAYLLKKDFWDQPNRGIKYFVRARVNNGPNDATNNWTIVQDVGGNFNTSLNSNNGAYENTQDHEVELALTLIFPASIQPYTSSVIETLSVKHFRPDTIPQLIDEENIDYDINHTNLTDIEFKSKTFVLQPGDYLYAQLNQAPTFSAYPMNGFYMEDDVVWLFEVQGKKIYRDDTVTISNLLEPYKLLDLFKGVIGLGQFKIDTDYNNQTVVVRPKKGTTVHGTSVDGFLLDDTLDYTNKIVKRSRVRSSNADKARFVSFAFAKSSDKYIGDVLGFNEEDRPIFSRRIDLGVGSKESAFIRNPFFEPTANNDFQELEVPAMHDNTNGNESFNIKPRILYAVGRYKQIKPFTELNAPAQWIWEGETEEEFLILSQAPTRQYFDGTTLTVPDRSVVYGNKVNDLFNLFIQFSLSDLTAVPKDEYLVDLSINDFIALDFRKRLVMYYEGQAFLSELLTIKDFDTRQDIPTIIETVVDQQAVVSFCAADYYMDMTKIYYDQIYDAGGALKLTNVIIDGEEKLSNPVDLGRFAVQTFPLPTGCTGKDNRHFSNIVDVINRLGLDNLYMEMSTRPLCPTPGAYNATFKYHTVIYNRQKSFELIFTIKPSSVASEENFARWTDTTNYYWNGSAWADLQGNTFEFQAQARIQI